MNRARGLVLGAAFVALGGSIAYGLWTESVSARHEAMLRAIQRAEDTLSFEGERSITVHHADGAVTDLLRVRGHQGRRAVEFVRPREAGAKRKGRGLSWLGRIYSLASGRGHGGMLARFADPGRVVRNYALTERGTGTVAGRVADIYELRPYAAGRASYRLWADRRNRFLLRFQVLSQDGAPVFESSHESIAFDPDFAPEAFGPTGGRRGGGRPFPISREAATLDDLRGLSFVAWLPARLPAGFERTRLETVRAKGMFESLAATYSDGMASVVVVEFRKDEPLWSRVRKLFPGLEGGVPGVARRVSHSGGALMNLELEDTEIFVAGQVSAAELEDMVRSLRAVN